MAAAARRLAALSLPELALLARAGAALRFARTSLARRGYAATVLALDRRARSPLRPALAGGDAERAAATARLVDAAGNRFPCRASCLPRALVLRMLLQRQGLAATLKIGVRLVGGRLEGHAWVEHAGAPLAQRPDVAERFRPFPGDVAAVAAWV